MTMYSPISKEGMLLWRYAGCIVIPSRTTATELGQMLQSYRQHWETQWIVGKDLASASKERREIAEEWLRILTGQEPFHARSPT